MLLTVSAVQTTVNSTLMLYIGLHVYLAPLKNSMSPGHLFIFRIMETISVAPIIANASANFPVMLCSLNSFRETLSAILKRNHQ